MTAACLRRRKRMARCPLTWCSTLPSKRMSSVHKKYKHYSTRAVRKSTRWLMREITTERAWLPALQSGEAYTTQFALLLSFVPSPAATRSPHHGPYYKSTRQGARGFPLTEPHNGYYCPHAHASRHLEDRAANLADITTTELKLPL